MEKVINFRTKLINSKNYAEKIAINKGANEIIKEIVKNNNSFFDDFLQKWISFINSYVQLKKFDTFILDDNKKNRIKILKEYVKKTFSDKKVEKILPYNDELKKLSSDIEILWKNFANSMTNEVLEQLGIYSLVCNNKKFVNDIINNINSINKWPIDESDYNKFIGRFEQGKKLLLSMNFTVEVEEFLKKVKEKRASLLDLTPEVLQWIKEEKLENNIMLSIKTFQY